MPVSFSGRRARIVFALAASFLLTASLALFATAALATSTMTVKPSADGFAQASSAAASSAGSTDLRIDGSPVIRTYLRFDLRGVRGTVTSATLRLFALSPSGIGYQVSRTDGAGFTESSLTWNSKPALGSIVGNSATFGSNVWTHVTVTSAVSTGRFVDFAIVARNGTAIRFASDDGTAADVPQLVVTLSGSTSAPPPVVSSTASPTTRPSGTPGTPATVGPTATPTHTPSATPTSGATGTPTALPSTSGSGFQIIAGGDTRTNVSGIQATAAIIGAHPGDPVLAVGDDTADGTTAEYTSFYNPAWGQFKSRIHPIPGNHEYNTSGAAGYFSYWGAQAGTKPNGWYSFSLPNNWHVIALNAMVNHAAGSPQELWLKADLASHPGMNIIAFWHMPRFTSSSAHTNDTTVTPFWNDLYAAHADLVFNGDSHQYERFALQNPSGQADPNGIRQFTSGLGGAPIYGWGTIQPNSQVRYNGSWGLLVLNLFPHSYSWQFVPVAGHTFTDTGTQATHH
jgi:hypothetical protein